jgi:hypothetical protein
VHVFQCGARGCGVTHFDTEFVDMEERKRRLATARAVLMGWDAGSRTPGAVISSNRLSVRWQLVLCTPCVAHSHLAHE